MNEKRFNKVFSTCIMVGMLLAIAVATYVKLQDENARTAMLLVAGLGSLMGVMSTVLSANGLIWTFLFGILDVALDSVVALDTGLMGNFALHAFYFLPMQLVGIRQWRRRGATAQEEVRARRLTRRQRLRVVLAVLGGLAVSYAVLYFVDVQRGIGEVNRSKVFLDAAVFTLNIVGQVLMSLAFMEQWVVWNLVNVFSILLWGHTMLASDSSSYTVVMFIKYCFYLLNSLNGLRIWLRLSRDPELA